MISTKRKKLKELESLSNQLKIDKQKLDDDMMKLSEEEFSEIEQINESKVQREEIRDLQKLRVTVTKESVHKKLIEDWIKKMLENLAAVSFF